MTDRIVMAACAVALAFLAGLLAGEHNQEPTVIVAQGDAA